MLYKIKYTNWHILSWRIGKWAFPYVGNFYKYQYNDVIKEYFYWDEGGNEYDL